MELSFQLYMLTFIWLIGSAVGDGSNLSQDDAEEKVTSETGYVDYYAGNLPLIFTTPHGGQLSPNSIPDRTDGCWDGEQCIFNHTCGEIDIERCDAYNEPDDKVTDLTMRMRDAIYDLTGKYPHVVLSLLKRTKMDPNREKNEATFGVPEVMKAWEEYYAYIRQAKDTFDGPGLLIDIHGQSHPIVRTEFGYHLTGDDLDNDRLVPATTTFNALASRVKVSFAELIRGETSLGALLEAEGYDAVPSPKYHGPDGNPYFSGAYTVKIEGSRDKGDVDAVMAESAYPYRTDEIRPKYAKSFAKAIVKFMSIYYDLKIEESKGTNKNGLIIGVVIAGCILLAAMALLIYWVKRKPKYQPQPQDADVI